MTDNPYYFSGVEIPYMESWALEDKNHNILLIDQNLPILTMVAAMFYMEDYRITRLKNCTNFNIVKKHFSNANCVKFSTFMESVILSKADAKTQQSIQEKLFKYRYDLVKALEEMPDDFLKALALENYMSIKFTKDSTVSSIIHEELGLSDDAIKQLRNFIETNGSH